MASELSKLFIVLGLKSDELSAGLGAAENKVKNSSNNMISSLNKISGVMLGVSAGIIAGFGVAAKASMQEEQMFLRLGNTLKNVGVNFDDVKESLDKTIMAMEKATATSHDELYAAFNKLLNITGDYEASLKLLPLALDLAKGASMDLETAARLVGRVEEGNTSILARYGIIIKEGATQTEVLEQITRRYGGSAEAMGKSAAGAMTNIKLSLDTLMEAIGKAILGDLKDFAVKLAEIIDGITKWVDKNPELVKTIFDVGVVITGLALALRGAAIAMAIFQAFSGPAGWSALGLSVGIALTAIDFIDQELKSSGGKAKPKGTPIYGDDGKITGYSKFASGGIVTQPTMAMIGEAGPEAVVPLSQMNTGDIVVRLYLDGAQIAEVIENRLGNRARLSGARNYV
jgi:hypothetical protein